LDRSSLLKQKGINLLQSLLLVGAMALLCGYLAWFIGGMPLAAIALAMVLFGFLIIPAASPRLFLRLYRGRPIDPREAPLLYELLELLAQRAALPRVPRLCHIPSQFMNAFSGGSPENAVIALSDGLLQRLSLREIAAVLAHELSHIRSNDLRLMGFADITSRLTGLFSLVGQVLLIINLPLMLLSDYHIAWPPIIILLLAPSVSALIQLALSRSREYNADLGAALLTGDPEGMASALQRMDLAQRRILRQILFPHHRLPEPSILRTHPPTEERVERLLALSRRPDWLELSWPPVDTGSSDQHRRLLSASPIPPRRHRSGLWY
jgi:heat shock protein HtpX